MAKKIVVYCCGGTGVNIGKLIIEQTKRLHAADNSPTADIQVVNIDTSESDLRNMSNRENTYLFKGMDGSGSDRKMNKDEIAAAIPGIINKFPPGDLSIVINSAGGGSGSVIGPMMLANLLGDSKLTIAIGVKNTDTVSRLSNTTMVLSSYEGISQATGRVLPVLLCDGAKESENNINNEIVSAVMTLGILFSGEIARLDSADLKNWINFNHVTGGEVGAMALMIETDPKNITDEMVVASVVSLANSPDIKVKFPRTMEYHPVGILESGGSTGGVIHFALVDGVIQEEYKKCQAELTAMEKEVAARKPRQSIASPKAGSNGIAF